jgi:hypothetical protein
MTDYTTITYRDDVLADQSVQRSYSDGTREWRRRLPDGTVEWQDTRGQRGVDELLGDGVVKRRMHDGTVRYGKEQGYGRTAWQHGTERVVTVNETSFGGRTGAILTAVGAAGLLGMIAWPPSELNAEEEAALREAQRQQSTSGGGGDTGSSSGSWNDDAAADAGDGDFG